MSGPNMNSECEVVFYDTEEFGKFKVIIEPTAGTRTPSLSTIRIYFNPYFSYDYILENYQVNIGVRCVSICAILIGCIYCGTMDTLQST